MKLYPLKFNPIFKKRIWGGQKLRESFGKDIPPFEHIGESWELADLPNDKSVIANGQLTGRSIAEALSEFPQAVTGQQDFSGQFRLLIKLLDAEEKLSVQVHPDAAACSRMAKGEPKTECWYIISAAPGAVIYKGLKKGVNRETLADSIKRGTTAKQLQKIPVHAGECHFLPAGTAHSIGAGLLIAEIQTPSDTTYRLFDWNRTDEQGKGRKLHIEEALESINFEKAGELLPPKTTGRLVDSDYFKIDELYQAPESEIPLSAGQMKVLMIITGTGNIKADRHTCVEFKPGDTILIPAAYEGVMYFEKQTQYLTITT